MNRVRSPRDQAFLSSKPDASPLEPVMAKSAACVTPDHANKSFGISISELSRFLYRQKSRRQQSAVDLDRLLNQAAVPSKARGTAAAALNLSTDIDTSAGPWLCKCVRLGAWWAPSMYRYGSMEHDLVSALNAYSQSLPLYSCSQS